MRKSVTLATLAVFVVLTVAVFQGGNAAAQENKYVGSEKCKGCHPQQVKDFESRKFAKAWTVLKMRGKTKDAECLKCHVTGFGKPGGFVSEDATPYLLHKQCEACHGAGGNHANNPGDSAAREAMKEYVSKQNVCIDCHRCMKTHTLSDEF